MAKKNLSLLRGSLTVIILALLVYVIIFFFFPDISIKYFGDAFNKEKALENCIVSLVYKVDYMTEEEKAVFEEYLSTEKGKEMVREISSAVSKGGDAIKELYENPEFQSAFSNLKEVMSPESFSKLYEETKSSAEKLFSWYKK